MPKISALTAATAPDADDLLYIVEDGSSRKATIEQVVKTATNATGTAPIYACRAWVNFNGTGTVAIRGSGNVSSITDNGVGDYTVNFATAMPDANYSVNICTSSDFLTRMLTFIEGNNLDVVSGGVRIAIDDGSGKADRTFVAVSVFR
jgi:hypothetical protein